MDDPRELRHDAQSELDLGPFDERRPPPLDFDGWSALSIALLGLPYGEQLDVLADREVLPELWEACNTFWLDTLSDQVARANYGFAEKYGKACLAHRAASHAVGGPRAKPDPEAASGAAGTHVAAPTSSVDETSFLAVLSPLPVLPFGPPRPHVANIAASDPGDPGLNTPPDLGGETAVGGVAAVRDPPLPFVKAQPGAGAAPTGGLSLEQYAALCADLARQPDHAEVVFERYGLHDAKARKVADAEWKSRLAADPRLRARWAVLFRQFRTVLPRIR